MEIHIEKKAFDSVAILRIKAVSVVFDMSRNLSRQRRSLVCRSVYTMVKSEL